MFHCVGLISFSVMHSKSLLALQDCWVWKMVPGDEVKEEASADSPTSVLEDEVRFHFSSFRLC